MAEKTAIGEAKVRLGEKITETVLLLWKNREHLPRHADPMERYAKAVEALRGIHSGMGARSKWDEFLPGKEMPAPLKFYQKSSLLGILSILEMIPEASEDIPDWLAQLIGSEEKNFVAVLGDAYARLSAENSAVQPRSSPRQKTLRQMRTKLLDELQELLIEMRGASSSTPAR